MRILTLLLILGGSQAVAAPAKFQWGTRCGTVMMAKTFFLKSTPVVYLQGRQGAMVLDPGAYDKGFAKRMELIGALDDYSPICITGYVNGVMIIPHKIASAVNPRLAERRQQEVLTEGQQTRTTVRQQAPRQKPAQQQQQPTRPRRTQRAYVVNSPSHALP